MTARSRLVFRLVAPTGVASTTTTRYVTTRGFRTAASDTPASTYIEERVAKAGGFVRSLFSGGAMGGLIRPNYGVLTLNNEDGGLDTLATYAGGGGEVTCWWGEDGAAFPGGYTQVYTATIASVLVDFDSVVIRQQDRFEQLNRPVVTATFAGTGGIEGTDNAARKKQLVFGEPGLVPLVLIDKLHQVYYVQANATSRETVAGLTEFGLVFEGGVPIDRGTPYPFKEYLFMDAHVPAPGTFRMWSGYQGLTIGGASFASQSAAEQYTKGPIYVRLGGVPVGELRFGAVGYLQNSSRNPAREWRFSDLCNRAGLNDVEHEEMAAMQNGLEDFTAGNRLVEGAQTYAQIMSDRCQALLGAAGFNRLDQFFCVSLMDPEDGSDASVYTFTTDNSRDFRRLPVPGMERPVWQVNVRAGRSWPCTVFSGASAEMQDLLTRQGYYVSFRGFSKSVRRRYPNAMSVDLDIDGHDFADSTAQSAFVERFGRLFGTRRDLMTLRCLQFDATTLGLELHDKVTLDIDRLGYSAGVAMRIVGIELDLDAQAMTITLWGNNSDWEEWSMTGGAFPADAGEPGGSWGSEDPPPELVGTAVNALMGDFSGLMIGGPIAELNFIPDMGDFAGVIVGESAGSVAVGLTTFFAVEESPSSTVTGDPVTERAAFMAMLSGAANEPFDGFSVGTSASIDVVRNGTTCTIVQRVTTDNFDFTDVEEVDSDVTISDNTTVGRFNTSGTSDRWLDCRVETGYDASAPSGLWYGRYRVQFTFSTNIAAFGFYGTDFGDFAIGQAIHAVLTDSDDVETTHTVTSSGAHLEGNLIFWGFVDDTKVYKKVVIQVDQAGGESTAEGLGIDDLIIATPAYLA